MSNGMNNVERVHGSLPSNQTESDYQLFFDDVWCLILHMIISSLQCLVEAVIWPTVFHYLHSTIFLLFSQSDQVNR